MKKIIILLFIGITSLFSASTEQIVQYLSLSQSDQQIIDIERVFDSMRNTQESNETNESTTRVTILYEEYLAQHLSADELEKILALYRTPVMERYVSEVKSFHVNQEDMEAFLESLKEEPLSTEREDIVDALVNTLVNEKLQLNFYRSMMQRYRTKESNSSQESNDTKMSLNEKNYLKNMKQSAKEHLLYGSQVFSMEEMKELKSAIGSSIFQKVKRVENEALIKIMNDYIRGVVSKPKRVKEKKKR